MAKQQETEMIYLDPKDIVINEKRRGRAKRPTKTEIKQRAESIKEQGQLQPCTVRVTEDGKYELVFGFTRYDAVQLLNGEEKKKRKLWCQVTDVSDQEALVMNIKENKERSDTTPIDDAINAKRLKQEFDWHNDQIGKVLNVSKAWVGKLLRLADIPASIKKYVESGALSATNAIALVDHGLDAETAKQVVMNSLVDSEDSKTGRSLSVVDPKKFRENLRFAVSESNGEEAESEEEEYESSEFVGSEDISETIDSLDDTDDDSPQRQQITPKKKPAKKKKKKATKVTKVRRNLSDVKSFFKDLTGPAEPDGKRELADAMVQFFNGQIDEKEFDGILETLFTE